MRLRPRPVSMLLRGQRREDRAGPVGHRLLVVLHEDEVPVLQEALVLAARQVLGRAVLDAAIDVELRAGAARARRAGLPEVLGARAFDDPLARHADLEPAVDRLLVGAEPELVVAFEDRHPDVGRLEAEHVQRQPPRELDRLVLEVVAEREVAEHLEEGEVAVGVADVVDVDRPEHLLAARQARRGRRLLAEEVGLQRVHARDRQQGRGVVRGGHQRRRGDAARGRAPRRSSGSARGSRQSSSPVMLGARAVRRAHRPARV